LDGEALRNRALFGRGGSFVFNKVHNIQRTVPVENIDALLTAVKG
jgi:uroporphyrinogen-III decarboxylase